MPHSRLVLAFLTALLLCACSQKGSWLQGKWVLDKEYTRQRLEEKSSEAAEKSEGLGGMVKNLATGMAAPMLLSMLENAEITFTEDEMITTINGNGKAIGYEVMETPDRDTVVIKKADGDIETYRRVDGRISTTSSGGVSIPVYLKPAP